MTNGRSKDLQPSNASDTSAPSDSKTAAARADNSVTQKDPSVTQSADHQPSVSAEDKDQIASTLRQAYQSTLDEQIPDSMLDLLRQLD